MARKRETPQNDSLANSPLRPNERRHEAPGYADEYDEGVDIKAFFVEDDEEEAFEDLDEPRQKERPGGRNPQRAASRNQREKDGF